MSFTNTVETVGDAALARSIIDKSITELNCNITTSIRQYAFRACAALEKISFPSCSYVQLGAFWECKNLSRAEFDGTVMFANNAFYGCSALKALILRNTEAVSSIAGTPFANSAIASGTGYIYVPSALVELYKANWTTYAAQIRALEDYPGIADPYTWAGVAANIADGSYASVYKVGDLVPLDLGSEGLVNMEIAGIDVDDLADGSGKAPISWISKELLATKHRMNPALVTNDDGTYQEGTGAIGGWEKCEMRAYLKETIKPLIPENVRGMIQIVAKKQYATDASGASFMQTTEDDVWIPKSNELSDCKKAIIGKSTYSEWWERSSQGKVNFYYMGTGGDNLYGVCTYARATALGFCT